MVSVWFIIVGQTYLGRILYPPLDEHGNPIKKEKKSKGAAEAIVAEEPQEKRKLTPAERAAKAQNKKKK